ncbi:endonuclease/exonuclease/phosphatase family protein [Botrimarina sp.]|uniref:endonuclease/exonuclease/phosphatase family protein n=1 Tax=Botrimarina sp. TaxID=2795802 RepID=UPI0032ECEAA2
MHHAVLKGLAIAAVAFAASAASAQLRIATYNTLHGPNPGTPTVLQAIGLERVNGFAKPVDVLLLQEQDEPFTSTQEIVNQLNALYGAGTYRRGLVATGPSYSDIRQTVIYRAESVQLIDERAIGAAGGNPLPARQALRARFRPVGYGEEADFYVYNNHYKAGGAPSDFDRRAAASRVIRTDADSLGGDAHVIFGGDFNLRSSFDDAFVELTRAGDSQAFDPAAFPGQWKNNFGARTVHTHGNTDVDDRFDFLLPTTEWRDGEGLDLIDGSYHVLGNNGSTYNLPVNSLANTYEFDFGEGASLTRADVLNALFTASDHLPVVADFQLPAVLTAWLGDHPLTALAGQPLGVDVFVENVADVLTPLGADELDFAIEWSGATASTAGQLTGVDLADGLPAMRTVQLDTSVVGQQTATLLVTTDSQGAAGGPFRFDLTYEVFAALAGDYNTDGRVDAADYTLWRDGLGAAYEPGDYTVWADAYGATTPTTGVPEPAAGAMLVVAVSLLSTRRLPTHLSTHLSTRRRGARR